MNNCIDAGREGCPCGLAESGFCLVCSKLNGGNCNGCNWQGSCIYTDYIYNGKKLNDDRTEERLMDIVEIRPYQPNFTVLILEADRGFCQKAQAIGTYVFAKCPHDSPWYSMPLSILKAEPDKGRIHLGVSACGIKSMKLLEQREQLSVRGIYRNGLSGRQTLKEQPENTFVYAKGIAMAPLRNFFDGGQRYARYLQNLHLYVDLDKVGFDFFRDYFGDLPAASIEICDFTQMDWGKLPVGPEDNLLVLASPFYVERIRQAVEPRKSMVYPVQGNFCCGEGVCGACTSVDPKGNTIRRCKNVE